jgi:tetratricopeptide (TPR) repeat protein
LQKSIALDPKLSFAHYNLGVAYQRLGMLQKAGKEFDQEMAITPQEPWSYENRGEVCLDLGQTDMAIKFYREALARRAQLPNSLAGWGELTCESSRPRRVSVTCRRPLLSSR